MEKNQKEINFCWDGFLKQEEGEGGCPPMWIIFSIYDIFIICQNIDEDEGGRDKAIRLRFFVFVKPF